MKIFIILSIAIFCTSQAFSQMAISSKKIQSISTEEFIEAQPADTSVVLISNKRELEQQKVSVQPTEETKNGQVPVIQSTTRKPE